MTGTYIDLFAGCGGLSLGLHKAGWKGLFAIEKSPDAFETLQHNLIQKCHHFQWPDWLPLTHHDINEVLSTYYKRLEQLKGTVDLVVGGPPCQGFSMAGRRQESDIRNSLVKAYIEFIKILQPKIIFLENVKGFTIGFEKNGSTKRSQAYSDMVQEKLAKIEYKVLGRLLNLGDFGIPQNRTRFILIGIHESYLDKHKEYSPSFFFKQLHDTKKHFLNSKGLNENVTLEESISDLLSSNGKIDLPDTKKFQTSFYKKNNLTPYQKLMRQDISDLSAPDSHRFARHKPETVAKFTDILQTSERNRNLNHTLREKYNIRKHTIIPLDGYKKSPTITTLPDDYIHYCEPRILTVREYARIQSFPDSYEFKGKYTTGGKERIKQVPRYSQIGNAIPPLFGEICGKVLQKLLR
ncbi:DNA cytosine methyltransferase [Akkermansia sp.]|uniref:DNA cytosine methyltransferase n=1 Tax=Akkermansia sp. TaxID=1872421 RepID=UPI0025C0FB59|nr:DNA cytosine methyltransferase [Akkermansia sp.]MCD8272561.1 DNA cytosine methyltransferase [Akkermansia sp.]